MAPAAMPPDKAAAFGRLRRLQQASRQTAKAWHAYADAEGGGVRDPRLHDAAFLRAFLDRHAEHAPAPPGPRRGPRERRQPGAAARAPRAGGDGSAGIEEGQAPEQAAAVSEVGGASASASGPKKAKKAARADAAPEAGAPAWPAWTAAGLAEQSRDLPVARLDPELLAGALEVMARWQERFPREVWTRMTKFGEGGSRRIPKVLKELNEIAPILRFVLSWVAALPADAPPAGVVDLCSGFGFLGMFLAELLPDPARVAEIILVDRGWPNANIGSKGSISADHIYDHGAWRVPIQTIKSDIKDQSNLKMLVSRLVAWQDRPCMVCAVHLCGTLSLRAAQLFNASTRAQALALVPCCMPSKKHARGDAVYQLGPHRFTAEEVRNEEANPTAGDRFRSWVENVSKTLDPGAGGHVRLEEIGVCERGGQKHDGQELAYAQNLYIFANRGEWGSAPRPPMEREAAAIGGPVVVEARWLQPAAAKAAAKATAPASEDAVEPNKNEKLAMVGPSSGSSRAGLAGCWSGCFAGWR